MQLKTQSTAQQGDVIIVTCWDKAMLNRRVEFDSLKKKLRSITSAGNECHEWLKQVIEAS